MGKQITEELKWKELLKRPNVVLGTYRFHALMPHAAYLYQKFIEKDLFSQKQRAN